MAVLFVPLNTSASVLLEQTVEDTLTDQRGQGQELGTGLSGNLQQLHFRVRSSTAFGADPFFYALLNCYRFSNYTGLCDNEATNSVATSTNTLLQGVDFPSGATSTLIFFIDNKTLDPSGYYTIHPIGGASNTITNISGAITNEFIDGSCIGGNCGDVLDLWFRVITETISTGIIAIIEPTQGTTTATTTVNIEVDYFNSGNADVLTLLLWNRVTSQQVILPVFDFPIGLGTGTATTTLELAENSYTLQATLFNSITGTQYGLVRNVEFNVLSDVAFTVFGVDISDPDSILTLATSTCGITNLSGCFQNALVFAFVPDVDSFDKFISLKDDLIDKPPFGYFALLADGLSNITSTSSPAFTLASEENITTNIFDPIKDGLTWLLWFAFGIWLYKRVKSMPL